MTGDRPTTPGWHCHRCRSTSCRQRADSDTDHVGRVEYRPLLLTQPSSVSWLWSHTHWCPSQRPQEVMRVDGSANPTMPKRIAPCVLLKRFLSYLKGQVLEGRHAPPLAGPGVPPALHLPFATSPCPVVPGDGSRGLVLDVTCRRVSITDHRLREKS